jgi:DNA-binding response OmpR family regulator
MLKEGKGQLDETPHPPQVLVVDNDDAVLKTLTGILESEGYEVESATNTNDALKWLTHKKFEAILINIKLQDKDGLPFLQHVHEIMPEARKIVITEPSFLHMTVNALNFGVQACIMKPIDPEELLRTIRSKFDICSKTESASREEPAGRIDYQGRKEKFEDFREYLQNMSGEMSAFGLTTNQAKVYVTLIAVQLGSVSEITASSGIRREEVYRIIPELEEIGLICSKVGTPHRFSAVSPEKATQILIRSKFAKALEEINMLESKRTVLVSQLKRIGALPSKDTTSIYSIPKLENVFEGLVNSAWKAKNTMEMMMSCEYLQYALTKYAVERVKHYEKGTKIRIITENKPYEELTWMISRMKHREDELVLKLLEHLPFNIIIIDDAEALWGQFSMGRGSKNILWTSDPVQLTILKAAFESLWNKASYPTQD